MPRAINRLTAKAIQNMSKPGLLADGGGLYLQVSPSGSKSWLYKFMLDGRAREMGLGSLRDVTLAEAREETARCRKLVRVEGIDPIDARKKLRAHQRLERIGGLTFKECAERYIEAHEPSWKNDKHASQWRNTLATYAYPVFGDLPVGDIDTTILLKAIEPIWTTKTETASRVRGRIETVLDWATVREYRTGDNPARWRGHLQNLLPARSKIQKVTHMKALPYDKLGAFVVDLRARESTAARALEFQILTATRPGETLGARWSEVDLKKRLWILPEERMKGGREHRVPLSDRAVQLLKTMRHLAMDDAEGYVFPGAKNGRPLSNMAPLALLRRMKVDVTAHGFRSTFSDWCAERTAFPSELREMALAHAIGDKVEAAYRRGDMFEKRRRLMDAWASFADKPEMESQDDNVAQLGAMG